MSPPSDDSYDSGEYDAGGYGTQTAIATPTPVSVQTASRAIGTTAGGTVVPEPTAVATTTRELTTVARARALPSTTTSTTASRVLAVIRSIDGPEIVHVSAALGERDLQRTALGERDFQRTVPGEVDR